MPRWKRLLLYLFLIAVGTGGYSLWHFIIHGFYVPTRSIAVEKYVLGERQITIVGATSTPKVEFKGYDYQIKGGKLYVGVCYGLVPYKNPLREFVVNIDTNPRKIKQIILMGKEKNDLRVIWQGEMK